MKIALRIKINAGMLLIFVAIALIFGLAHHYAEMRRQETRIEEAKRLLMATFEGHRPALADHLLANQTPPLANLLEEMKIQEIVAVRLFQANGELLLSTVDDAPGSRRMETTLYHSFFQLESQKNPPTLVYSAPIRPNRIWENVGYLTIHYDLSHIESEFVNSTRLFFGTLVTAVALFMIFINMLSLASTEPESSADHSPENKPAAQFWLRSANGAKMPPNQKPSTAPAPSAVSFSGLRTLLIEDSRIDQIVARELFKETGIALDIVESGEDALLSLDKANYHLALINIRLPVMDGYETCRKIRESGRSLPIIGIDSGAAVADQEKCLAAGMNALAAKPLNTPVLLSILHKWLKDWPAANDREYKGAIAPMSANESAKPDGSPAAKSFRLQGIDADSALKRIRGNEQLFLDLLHEFQDQAQIIAERLISLLDQAPDMVNRSKAFDAMHSLKNISGNISAQRLYDAIIELETVLKENQRHEQQGALSRFREAFNEVSLSIEQFLPAVKSPVFAENHPSPPAQVPNTADLINMLRELHGYLRANNPKAGLYFATIKPLLLLPELTEKIKQLEASLNEFNFRQALKQLTEISQKLNIADKIG